MVLADVSGLTYPISLVRKAITAGNYGQTMHSKDFLQPGQVDAIVKRGEKSRRHRCTVIFLDSIDQEVSCTLQKCEHNITLQVYYIR